MNGTSGARILVVDDDRAILRTVRTNLLHYGFQVEISETGRQALERYTYDHPDLILLDLWLPDMDGLEIIKTVRARSNTPIVVLSARGADHDKVLALDLGADDYLTKPFSVEELLARVRVALRHAARPVSGTAAVFRTGELEVDVEHRHVSVRGAGVRLSPIEYELLKALITHPNKVLTDRMLLEQVWGNVYGAQDHYLHVYMARLRKKIESDPRKPHYLLTEPGVGYRLRVDED